MSIHVISDQGLRWRAHTWTPDREGPSADPEPFPGTLRDHRRTRTL